MLNKATTAKEVFAMTKWHKSVGSYRTPHLMDPLHPNAPPAVSLHAKRDALVRNLLRNEAEVDDIPLSSPAVAKTSLPFPDVTTAEVADSILKAKSSAPGEDEISTVILRAAWHLIERQTKNLYQACLEAGHHPSCFRSAILVVLAKPNKSDRSNPGSYRPIALLSVLGKGLERLIAKRMAWIAVTQKVLTCQQFGAVPHHSAVDLTTCLTHDVETALNSKLKATMLTLDVKGAFNGVLPGRLVRRLREQGWPDNLAKWVGSFSTQRLVKGQTGRRDGPSNGDYLWPPSRVSSIANSFHALRFSSLPVRKELPPVWIRG